MLEFVQNPQSLRDGTTYNFLKDFSLPLFALAWGVYSYWRQNRKKLSLRQVGDQSSDRIVLVDGCIPSYAVEMAITNDSPNATIVIAYYDIEVPWNEPNIEPLDDPKDLDKAQEYYSPRGFEKSVPREKVLNHRRYQNGKLTAGEAFRGHFLAKGEIPIPRDLRANEIGYVEAKFVVQDTTGKQYKSLVHLHF